MPPVLSMVAFRCHDDHRDAFLAAARKVLKPFWESKGSSRYEVYAEIGPTGPTGRVVEVNHFPDRDAYQRLSDWVRTATDLPAAEYRHLYEPEFHVLEQRVG
jgi:quinol monooxygenase YgiN